MLLKKYRYDWKTCILYLIFSLEHYAGEINEFNISEMIEYFKLKDADIQYFFFFKFYVP